MIEKIHFRRHLSSFQIIILSFAGVILFGAFILMLPISSAAGIVTPFHSAIFTSTSAVCVTGLVVLDTGSYWSPPRAGSDFAAYTDRRTRSYNGGGVICNACGQKNITYAAQHNAGRYFSAKARRNSPSDKVCSKRHAFNRTNRCIMYASVVLRRIRCKRNMEGCVSFRIGFLQCRI